jgi:uncharacterized membrane protein
MQSRRRFRTFLRWLLALVYVPFGVLHLTLTDQMLPIMPSAIPFPREVIVFTGLCEIAGGLALLWPRTRRFAGIMLALYAVAVYPANVHHAVNNVDVSGLPSTWWYHAPRLAFQPVFIWWALFAGEVIDWPLRAKQRSQDADLGKRR